MPIRTIKDKIIKDVKLGKLLMTSSFHLQLDNYNNNI